MSSPAGPASHRTIAGSDVAASSRGVADAQEKLKADSSSEGTGRERGAAKLR